MSGQGVSGISRARRSSPNPETFSLTDCPHHPQAGVSSSARILHISADFPDPVAPGKTRVIQSFLELTQARFDHRVISINRRSPSVGGLLKGVLPGATMIDHAPFTWGQCLTYAAPGRGIFHRTHLLRLADAIAAEIRGGPLPDLIVGHKLTVEGFIVQRLSALTGVPFAITIQGNTDTKILAARPDLAAHLRAIFHEASSVTAFAPWAAARIEARLGKRSVPVAIIPCPTELDTPIAPRAGGNGLLSVFHLHGHQNKNLAGMVKALRLLHARGRPQTLAICGGGSDADLAAAQRSAVGTPGVVFEGPLGREAVPARMNAAAAFVMPSFRESFGLVFIEALFAGLPIIYPEHRAVAGWFDGSPFAIPVPPGSPAALADAMDHAAREESALKSALAQWQASAEAQRFRRDAIAEAYAVTLAAACGERVGAASVRRAS